MYDAVIIGAGSAGLMCAARLVSKGLRNFVVLDSNSKPGKKLAVTGNGRCNLTNLKLDNGLYFTDDPNLLESVISRFTVIDTINFFEKTLGLKTTNKDELVYPWELKSSAVIDVLRLYIPQECFDFDSKVISIIKEDDHFVVVSDKKYEASNIVIATGGKSYVNTGSDGSGYKLLASLVPQDSFVPISPSLVQLKTSDRDLKALSGYRFNCNIRLVCNGDEKACETGELLFTDYGISGICTMQLSRYLESGKNTVVVDFLEKDEDIIRSCIANFCERSTREALAGVLPGVLTDIVLKRIGVRKLVSNNEIDKFINELHDFNINISGTNGLDNAQVTRGGLKLSALDDNLQSKLVKGLYVCGEVVNVDGPCGGYNLQWAWSSSVVVADDISRSNV